MTPQQAIKRAMRLNGLLQAGESPSADESDDALDTLNSMLHSWEIDGIPLDHTDMALTDTIPYDERHDNAIVYKLAIELAPEYEEGVSQIVASRAFTEYNNLRHLYSGAPTFDIADGETTPKTYY